METAGYVYAYSLLPNPAKTVFKKKVQIETITPILRKLKTDKIIRSSYNLAILAKSPSVYNVKATAA